MKRSLFFAFICFTALRSGAQNIPLFAGEYVPFHQFMRQHVPVDNVKSSPNTNQLKDYNGTFVIGSRHLVNGSQGWNVSDSSTFTYRDSLPFAVGDTTIAYNATNQSWTFDSTFSITAYYLPSSPVTDEDSFAASRTGTVYNTGTSSWSNTDNYNYTYDGQQRLISLTYQTWNGTGWTNVRMNAYSYNSYNQIDTLSVFSGSLLTPDTQYVYYYNAAGQDSIVYVNVGNGSGWDTSMKYVYEYTPINNLFTGINISSFDDTVWKPYGVYSYYRDNNQATYLLQLYNGGSQLVNVYEENFNFDYRNNVTSFSNDSFSGNTPKPLIQYLYSYDINNDLTYEQDAYWNSGTNSYTGTDIYYYYYEWLPVVGAIHEVDNALNASLFPNPSSGQANISLNAASASQVAVSVFNAIGQKVSETNTQVIAGANTLPLQLNQLAAGNYLINIRDVNSGKSSSLNWVKQ